MNVLALLRQRFAAALSELVEDPAPLVDLVRPSQGAQFGDYQANCAMPLGKQLGKPPREVAQSIVDRLEVDDLCETPEIAGPGFINLRLKQDWLAQQVAAALADPRRLAVERAEQPRNFVIDFSAPNVAKPMHVGHIRSTVIGASLVNVLSFLGHQVTSDNHIGDWGTQFGMIIYGYKNFRDAEAYRSQPVAELGRLYRLVSRLVDYQEGRKHSLPELTAQVETQTAALAEPATEPADEKQAKKAAKARKQAENRLRETQQKRAALADKLGAVEADGEAGPLAAAHPNIDALVLEETAKLHAGDAENRRLWEEFLPVCLEELEKTYRRIGVTFDHALGESFYHDRLAGVVDDLKQRGLARTSDGAVCVFLDGFDVPMIIQKRDGAFLYATTDLATLQYRVETFAADAVLYVVDHRQSDHFKMLFATARLWGLDQLEMEHLSFGTVMGEDGKPYKTRSGDTVGLTLLLDEAVERAHRIVCENDDAKPGGAELSADERRQVAEAVGIGALKYADLSHNRTSDYVFSYDKMLAMNGNTATYMQYAHARVRSIFARGDVSEAELAAASAELMLEHPAERALALELLRFSEALDATAAEYRPNLLTNYLFQLADCYSAFYQQCPVLKAETDALRLSRLRLCYLTANTLRLGLALLGIQVVEKM
ncbi:MAG: arginine--tRNA ligase [Planctomycetales bacterium]|nr:arginine--tRNA ligase [Planctomycetales bacterium]